MNYITLVVRGTATEHDTFVGLAAQARAYVSEHEPDTVRYDCFVDPATSQFVWHEIYQGDHAALQHIQNLMSTRLPPRVAEVVNWESMTVLGVIEDEDLLGTLKGMCAEADIDLQHFTDAVGQVADRV